MHEERTAAQNHGSDEPHDHGADRGERNEFAEREDRRRTVDGSRQNRGAQIGRRLFERKSKECPVQCVVVVKVHSAASSAPKSLRSCSLARNKCVFTVPIGNPSTTAISS